MRCDDVANEQERPLRAKGSAVVMSAQRSRSRRRLVTWLAACAAIASAGQSAVGASPTPASNGSGGWGRLISVDPPTGFPTAISCVSETFCGVVDARGAALVGGGSHWKRAEVIDPGQSLVAVSCTSTVFCAAADAQGSFFTFDGSRWSFQQALPAAVGLDSIGCATPTFCLAVTRTSRHLLAFDGTQWTAQSPIPGVTADLTSVSCAAPDWCGVGDAHGRVAVLDATGWGTWHHGPNVGAHVQCPVPQFCLAVVGSLSLIDSAGVWSTVGTGTSQSRGLSCASATMCAMAGPNKSIQVFNGTSWRHVAAHEPLDAVEAMACVPASWCVEVEDEGGAQEWDGTRWTDRDVRLDPVRGVNDGGGVTCPAVSFCALVDYWGNVAFRLPSGWTKPKLLPVDDQDIRAACATANLCVALVDGDTEVWDGTRWHVYTQSPVSNDPQTIGCARTAFCMAISNIAASVSTDGVNWTQIGPPGDSNHNSWEVSCASPTFCMTLEENGTSVVWNGSSWAAPQEIDGGKMVWPLSCGAPALCVTGVGNGQVVTWQGGAWSTPVQVFTDGNVGVSCTSATFCAALDNGQISTFDGSTWSTPETIDGDPLIDISCASSHFCTAMDAGGNVVSTRSP